MKTGMLITGTDTGIGKTLITATLANVWKYRGRSVRVSKPVQSGAAREHPDGDAYRLQKSTDGSETLSHICPYAFSPPFAPPWAAALLGQKITMEMVFRSIQNQFASAPDAFWFIEGVGGFLSPLTEDGTVADLAQKLALPVLIVSHSSTGAVNATLLTVEAIRKRDVPIAAIVFNVSHGSYDEYETTHMIDWIETQTSLPVFGPFPHQKDEQPQTLLNAWLSMPGAEQKAKKVPMFP
ncbi:dethiobiotin synthase [Pasteuria penetrans]|uniref:dethiobiotin synthase n=1 Tax=Pasteuria penetrans TaxID=86005 RepID=UPI000FBE8888|nr:dethiobiotin synthase [Pasteuria penetrans]